MKARRSLLLALTPVLVIVGASGVWVWKANRQYTLNRQLIAALVHNDSRQALALVNAGADPNTRCHPPPAPTFKRLLDQLLHRSPAPADDSPTSFLLACGGGLQWTDDAGIPALADDAGCCQLAETMLAHGADLNAPQSNDDTPIRAAVNRNRLCLIELLLAHGANVDTQGTNGSTSLMVAAAANAEAMTRLLLTRHADMNIQNHDGNTALHFAVWNGKNKRLVQELMARGANPNLRNVNAETPLSLAREQKRPDFVALLRKDGK